MKFKLTKQYFFRGALRPAGTIVELDCKASKVDGKTVYEGAEIPGEGMEPYTGKEEAVGDPPPVKKPVQLK